MATTDETATYIGDLATTPTIPTDTAGRYKGGAEIRKAKQIMKASFPNVTGAVTPTHTELNYVDGVTSAIQTQLDTKAPTADPTFTGEIGIGSVNVSETELGLAYICSH